MRPLLVALALTVALSHCSGKDGSSQALADAGAADATGAAESDTGALAAGPGAFDPGFATSPAFFTQMTGRRHGLSTSPHNLVQIWYSANIAPLVELPSFTAPPGTVAIKLQDSTGSGTPDAITVMIKQAAGYDPANGDWLYERRGADGSLQESGKVVYCSSCHTGFPATDDLPGVVLRDPMDGGG